MTARELFTRLALAPGDIDLGLAAALVASEAYPELDPAAVVQRLDELAAELAARLEHAATPIERLRALVSFLRQEIGLRGNAEAYYDPRNSLINDVLERGLGIPISLAVVYIEVARRVGVPLRGVAFPQHFLLKHCAEPEVFLDPFAPERPLGPHECAELLARASGSRIPFEMRLLEPVSNRQIVARMLTNLKLIYVTSRELDQALACIDRILLVAPQEVGEYRDRGRLHAHLGNLTLAQEDFEHYLMHAPGAPDAPGIQTQIDALRHQIGVLH